MALTADIGTVEPDGLENKLSRNDATNANTENDRKYLVKLFRNPPQFIQFT
jgi:hypothetical protein